MTSGQLPVLPVELTSPGRPCQDAMGLFTSPDVFERERPKARKTREALARILCGHCPAGVACLEYALQARPPEGIWGGLNPDQIAELADARELAGVLVGEVA